MTLINFLIQQHNYPLPQHINVIGFRHFSECSKSHSNPALFRGIKSGNKRRNIFKTTSSKN